MVKAFSSKLDFNKILLNNTELCYNSKDITFDICYLIHKYSTKSFALHSYDVSYLSISSEFLKTSCNYKMINKYKIMSLLFDIYDKDCGNSFSQTTLGYRLKGKYLLPLLSGDYILDSPLGYVRGKLKQKTIWCFDDTKLYNSKSKLMQGENMSRRLVDKNIDKIKHECYQMVTKEVDLIQAHVVEDDESLLKNTDYCHTFEINITECNTFKDNLLNDIENNVKKYHTHNLLALSTGLTSYEHGYQKMYYKRVNSGRLVGVSGIFDAVNYQTFPKSLRKIIFKGYYEYDICNSAPTLLSQYFNKKVNKTLPNLNNYINNKDYYRNLLVKRGFTYNQAKQYLLAMTFGSKMDIDSDMYYENKDWAKETGVELVKNAVEDIEIMELYLDVQEMFNTLGTLIKEKSKKENGKYYIYNKVNKCKVLSKWDTSKAVMHKYFGLESFILDILKDTFECNLLLYDAIITKEDLDTEELSSLVFMESDYKVQFEKIKIGEAEV